eukprot:m.33393 g.33393  ORF g.33393 m.33393 type:complete len:138 (-) comp5014_c0_seq1:197-610(-)
MLLFCPTCGNILTLKDPSPVEEMRFICATCPYVQVIDTPVSVTHTNRAKKDVALLLGDNAGVGKAKASSAFHAIQLVASFQHVLYDCRHAIDIFYFVVAWLALIFLDCNIFVCFGSSVSQVRTSRSMVPPNANPFGR